jgi:tetratricopeptide (TPR) repeat protein
MKNFFFLTGVLASLLLASPLCAQEKKAESYKMLKDRASRTSIEQLLREAETLKKTNPSQALNHVQDALGMSLAQRDLLNEAKCYLLLGEINEGIQEWGLALDNYQRAHQRLSTTYRRNHEYARALRGLGNMHLKLAHYDQALQYFGEAARISLSETETAERQLDISEVYYQMQNYPEALRVVEGIKIPAEQNELLESKIQNQKARIYARLNEVDKANDLFISSQRTLRSAGNAVPMKESESIPSAKEEISGALRGQKRYDEDISLRNEAIEYNIESKNFEAVPKDKIELSKSLADKGETSEAIRELEEAAHLADTLNNPREQADAFLQLAFLYEKNGRWPQALGTYKKYSEAVDRTEKLNEQLQVERAELLKKQKEIEELSGQIMVAQQQEQTTLQRQQLVIYALLAMLVIIIVTSFFIYRNAQASKRANQLLALKSLRSQMNPHFIFNALNSVNQFISQNDERTANKFLSEFSRLMRLVLENSQEDFIPLQKEEEIIALYVKLEHYRFRDKFDYSIRVDDDLNKESIEIPPMLIQPYIENAVWHGLRYKETKGKLDVHIGRDPNGLKVEITDDGIGRRRSAELKTDNQKKHNSTGLKNISERLHILNAVYKTDYRVRLEDLPGDGGTRVIISLPLKNGKEL